MDGCEVRLCYEQPKKNAESRWMKKYSKVCYSFAPTTTMSIVILFCFMGEEWKARQGFLAKDSSLRPVPLFCYAGRPLPRPSTVRNIEWCLDQRNAGGRDEHEMRWDEKNKNVVHSFFQVNKEGKWWKLNKEGNLSTCNNLAPSWTSQLSGRPVSSPVQPASQSVIPPTLSGAI